MAVASAQTFYYVSPLTYGLMELLLTALNAFLKSVKLTLIPLPENPLLPSTTWANVVSVISARVVLPNNLPIANASAKLDNKSVSSTIARLAKLLALEALELVLLKASLLLE